MKSDMTEQEARDSLGKALGYTPSHLHWEAIKAIFKIEFNIELPGRMVLTRIGEYLTIEAAGIIYTTTRIVYTSNDEQLEAGVIALQERYNAYNQLHEAAKHLCSQLRARGMNGNTYAIGNYLSELETVLAEGPKV